MKLILETDELSALEKAMLKAKQSSDASNFSTGATTTTKVTPPTKVTSTKKDDAKSSDAKSKTTTTKTKETSAASKDMNVNRIDKDKKFIDTAIINAYHFYTGVIGATQSYNLNEEYFEKLFIKRLPYPGFAKYCDLMFRITDPTGTLSKVVNQQRKKFDYFISRNKTSTSIQYLQNFIPAQARSYKFKTLNDLFTGEFYDYVVEDFSDKALNLLQSRDIITYKNSMPRIAFKPMTDNYIINLVNYIYDNKIYGEPVSFLK
jgi:hypothetical protein